MNGNNQTQKAGCGSNQIQTQEYNVYHIGITEERARQIVDEKIQEVICVYSVEARDIAVKRIREFSDELMPRLVRENLLENLKDPGVQMLLKEAEKKAVVAERKSDYELLTELLIHRVKRGSDYSIKMGVNYAIKILDDISDEALLGITTAYAIESSVPGAGEITQGLMDLNNLFSKVVYDALPKDSLWIEQLDILKAVRYNSFGRLKKYDEFITQLLAGYVDVGIKKESEAYFKALQILRDAQLPNDILVPHELRKDYIRLRVVNRERLDYVFLTVHICRNVNGAIVNESEVKRLSEVQKKAVSEIYDIYDNNPALYQENKNRLMEMMDSFDALKKVKDWWDSIEGAFSITSVGRVLAHANAKRCDPSLPDLD